MWFDGSLEMVLDVGLFEIGVMVRGRCIRRRSDEG